MKRIIISQIFVFIIFSCFFTVNSQTSSDAGATGISRAFNPAISANGLFGAMFSDKNISVWDKMSTQPGFHLQDACLELTSNVDIYLQSKFTFGACEEEGLAVEEAYLTTLRMPIPVIVKGGKMLNAFGRYNLYHSHHMAFAENPMILENVFGPKLDEAGIEASYLLPLSWYSDVTAGILNGNNANLFQSDKQEDLAYLIHLDNLWEAGDEITFRIGGSFLLGERGLYYSDGISIPFDSTINSITSSVWGIDFHLKWKPLQYGRYRSFVLEGEYVNASLDINENRTDPLHGYYTQALYQFKLRWWVQARYEWFKQSKDLFYYFPCPEDLKNFNKDLTGSRVSFALAYVPTEFGAYRIQYNMLEIDHETEHQVVFQVNVTIGSHPAHKY
jgi:hypothetical protein